MLTILHSNILSQEALMLPSSSLQIYLFPSLVHMDDMIKGTYFTTNQGECSVNELKLTLTGVKHARSVALLVLS